MLNHQYNQQEIRYSLVAMIDMWETKEFCYYTAIVREDGEDTHSWLKLHDGNIEKIQFENVNKYREPHILFYKRQSSTSTVCVSSPSETMKYRFV